VDGGVGKSDCGLQHYTSYRYVKHSTRLRCSRQHNNQKLARRHRDLITPQLQSDMLHSYALSSLAFTLALLVSVVCFLLFPAVKSGFLIPNLDSYSLNNCIHMSLLTGSHHIIAGPRIFFFFLFLVLHFFVFGRLAFGSPCHVSMAVHHDPFYLALPRIAYLNPLTLESIPNLLILRMRNSTPLCGFWSTDFREKAFLDVNPASSPPRFTTVVLFTSSVVLGPSTCQRHLSCTASLSIPYSLYEL
jgi:hypothetical protein